MEGGGGGDGQIQSTSGITTLDGALEKCPYSRSVFIPKVSLYVLRLDGTLLRAWEFCRCSRIVVIFAVVIREVDYRYINRERGGGGGVDRSLAIFEFFGVDIPDRTQGAPTASNMAATTAAAAADVLQGIAIGQLGITTTPHCEYQHSNNRRENDLQLSLPVLRKNVIF